MTSDSEKRNVCTPEEEKKRTRSLEVAAMAVFSFRAMTTKKKAI